MWIHQIIIIENTSDNSINEDTSGNNNNADTSDNNYGVYIG